MQYERTVRRNLRKSCNVVQDQSGIQILLSDLWYADMKLGTRFDTGKDRAEAYGFKPGWNRVDGGHWVWFKYVGCHGYEFIIVSDAQRTLAIERADTIGDNSDYWNYTEADRAAMPEWDNGTCTRNERLYNEDPIEFLARLIKDASVLVPIPRTEKPRPERCVDGKLRYVNYDLKVGKVSVEPCADETVREFDEPIAQVCAAPDDRVEEAEDDE